MSAEPCVCGHDLMDHRESDGRCFGDFGQCSCRAFEALDEETAP